MLNRREVLFGDVELLGGDELLDSLSSAGIGIGGAEPLAEAIGLGVRGAGELGVKFGELSVGPREGDLRLVCQVVKGGLAARMPLRCDRAARQHAVESQRDFL